MVNLQVQDFQWVKGTADDPDDQCAHGRVLFQVNDTIFVEPEDGIWTISASALYLLRTLSEDHTVENPVAESNFLFPCCGFTVWPAGKRFKVLCMGCNTGVDVEIFHSEDMVTIASPAGTEKASESEWNIAVLGFVNSVQDFYRASAPKIVIEDEYDNQGWAAFWQEWNERYQDANRQEQRLTMRAADGGESARFMSLFLALSFFCSQTFLYPRPLSAANASRWVPVRKYIKLILRKLEHIHEWS